MGLTGSRRRDVTRAAAWVNYLLLAFGMLLPVVCVVWLTRKAVENENKVVQRLVSEARARKLQDAEQTLRSVLEDGSAEALEVGFVYEFGQTPKDDLPADEKTAARLLLREGREFIVDAEFNAAQNWLLEKLGDLEAMSLRFGGQRHVGPALLEMLIEKKSETERFSSEFLSQANQYVKAFLESNAPLTQKRYLLNYYEPVSGSPYLKTQLALFQGVAEWTMALQQSGNFPPAGGLGEIGSVVYYWNQEKQTGLILEKDAFVGFANSLLDPEGIEVVNIDSGVKDESVLSRKMSPPLGFALLVLDPSRTESELSSGKAVFYIWIGGIVLVLSLLTGTAIVYSLRRQASVTALKDNLVATVTHELKTPVSSIRLLVDTLLNRKGSEGIDTDEYLELISRENKRLGRLIDNFLSFSRMERNKASFSIEPISAELVVSAATNAFRDRFAGQDFDLKVSVDRELPEIAGDEDALATVLGNLLENAFKYGGDEKTIELSASSENRYVVFSVKDYGEGIARRDQKRVFRKFFRIDQNHAEHAGSVGLGLSIVEFIVSKHSGRIVLESEIGKGSEFKIKIPYA